MKYRQEYRMDYLGFTFLEYITQHIDELVALTQEHQQYNATMHEALKNSP